MSVTNPPRWNVHSSRSRAAEARRRRGATTWYRLEFLEDRTLLALSPILTPTAAYTSGTTLIPITTPSFSTTTTVTDGSETVTFDEPAESRTAPNPAQWSNWGSPPNVESNSTQVLWESGDTTSADPVTLTLSTPATTFGFEMQQNNFSSQTLHADFFSGATLIGSIDRTVTVPGAPGGSAANGALLFAATSTDPTQPITSVVITSSTNVNGVGIARIRYALPGPDLVVAKTGPATVAAGDLAAYSVTVTNTGTAAAANVDLTDSIPAGATFWAFGAGTTFDFASTGQSGPIHAVKASLAPGATATLSYTLKIAADNTAGTTLTNTASVTTSTPEGDTSDNSASFTSTVVTSADLAVTKTDSPDPVIAGNNLTYTVTLTNDGPSDAQTVTLTDAVPFGTTFVSVSVTTGSGWSTSTPAVGGTGNVVFSKGTVAAGETATFTIVVRVNADAANGPAGRPPVPSTVTNTATAASATNDSSPGNNTATATTTVIASADLAVTKIDSPDPVIAGNTLAYAVTVTNNGPSDAQGVTLQDFLPSNVTFVSDSGAAGWTTTDPLVGSAGGPITAKTGTLAAGASATFTVVVRVLSSVADGSIITNSAHAASPTFDPTPGNNTATATTAVHTLADLSVSKTAAPDPVAPGGTITYVVTVANNGPSDARNVTLTDILSDRLSFVSSSFVMGWTTTNPTSPGGGTFTSATPILAAGSSTTFTIVVRVSPDTPSKTVITNQASAATSTPESGTANNTGTATTLVLAPPTPKAELSITMTAAPSPVSAGSKLVYRIVVTNNGPDEAQGVVWTDLLPANATFLAADQTGGPAFTLTAPAVGSSGGTVTGSVASLAPGASATFAIAVKVGSQAVVNRSSVTSTNASTKSATLSTPVATSSPAPVSSVVAARPQTASPSRTPAPTSRQATADVQVWDVSLERSVELVADVVRQKASSGS